MTSSARPSGLSATFLLLLVPLLFIGTSTSFGQPHDKADELFEAMEIRTGSWAADVGGGDGDYTLPMAERVGPSGRVLAVDVDPDALQELNEKLAETDVENVTTVYSIEDNPMLPTNTLDAVLVRNAYHHFTEHQSMLRHIRAGLKPGGRLVIEESVSEDMVGESREAQVDNHDIGIGYVREELRAAGFTIEKEVNPFVDADGHFHWMLVATGRDS